MTGSFLDAICEGMSPEMKDKIIEIKIKLIAVTTSSFTNPEMPVKLTKIMFKGILIKEVNKTPIKPAQKPKVIVSALNKVKISLFEAPKLRSIPISLVLSSTEI